MRPDRSGSGRRVKLMTLGCRLNEAEAEDWALRFQQHGFCIVGSAAPADLIVINTCAVTQDAARKSRQLLRRSQRANPGAKLIASGCLATLEGAALARETGVALVVDNSDKDLLVERTLAALALPTLPAPDSLASALFARGRQRAFVKAQDGCRYRCTFCVATLARGAERSRPVGDLIASIDRLHDAGIREVVLTGVQLAGYRDAGCDLTTLVAKILANTGIARLRLGSLEPWELPDAFWSLFGDTRLMPHLHLPLQSGSDAVLRRMARRCKTAEFAQRVARARALVPELNVTTDIIVGFPGERADDWQRTLDFVEALRFGNIHVFGYSPRPGTLAASLPDPVSAETKKRRIEDLQTLAVRLTRETLQEQIGKRTRILCEGAEAGECQGGRFGYTPNYLPVRIRTDAAVTAERLLEVVLTGLTADGAALIGQPLRASGA